MRILCDQCGSPLQPLANYCSYCGTQAPRKTVLIDEKQIKPIQNPMYCPHCGTPVLSDALYCHTCGFYLYRKPTVKKFYCPRCNELNRNDARNCASCGFPFADWFRMQGIVAENIGFQGEMTLHEKMNDIYYHFIRDTQTVTLGRQADNDIVIPAPWVSGNHCKINLHENRITDMNSKNGTFVNRNTQPITAFPLRSTREFNLAGFFTYTTVIKKNAFVFCLTAILEQNFIKKIADLAALDELRKHYYILFSGDADFYVYKINGRIDKQYDVLQEAWRIRILNNFYYFSDVSENDEDRLLLKNGKNFPVNWEILT